MLHIYEMTIYIRLLRLLYKMPVEFSINNKRFSREFTVLFCKMANAGWLALAGLDSLVRRIIEHADFKQAVNTTSSSSVAPSLSGVIPSLSGVAAPSFLVTASATAASNARRNALVPGELVNSRTSREELHEIFHQRNASAPPQFQNRTPALHWWK